MVRWSVALLFFCSACQSKPVSTPEAAPNAKLTQSDVSGAPPVEIFTSVVYGPRRAQEIESAVALSPRLQTCLVDPSVGAGRPVTLSLAGKITYRGIIEALQVKGGDKALESCARAALKELNLGRGRIGPFKMQVSTDRSKFPEAKGLILQPAEIKKFE